MTALLTVSVFDYRLANHAKDYDGSQGKPFLVYLPYIN